MTIAVDLGRKATKQTNKDQVGELRRRIKLNQFYTREQGTLEGRVRGVQMCSTGSRVVKPVLSGHSKRRPKLVFKTDYIA